ncbi:hypothetical protein DICSQDRAFT_179783 [Dichomitus squalens LYAD-421 SS1]|uniref:uncharacterized protein n=1 Tax=Dichomitus squalens (strain LYAD-421) TaxID=732165 RepID=UPI000441562F|nr:uncharacterized protein DICSQDRAFT_179783 [Dichomitus squalens LYAD-421 SS1]EJF63139.1 hypothetical protein DICSQDRAFT_179783 [Dichomitus squalens LYAD-421 SS1]
MTQWNWKTRRQDGEDGHPPSSSRLYEEDTGTQAPDSVITGEEEKHSILEDLISDAFDSPVFDCLSTPNPNAAYSSGSVYSQPSISPHDSLADLVTSRPATQSSFASTASSDDSRRRKFAARRQAIYAEFGFKLPIPDSESSSSLRHTHIPTGSSKPFNGAGSSRTTSAYVPLRSAWSTSTSATSVRSQLLDQADASLNDDPDPASLILPYSSSINLANLANDKLERFSVQDSFLSSSRNPLLQDRANFTTSTPPAKRRSHRSLAKLAFDSLPDVPALPDFIKRPTMSRHASGFGWQPCAPLRLAKLDIDGGSTIRQSLSTSERVRMFAKWRDYPEYHPIVKELMDDVDKSISEWNRGCPIVA